MGIEDNLPANCVAHANLFWPFLQKTWEKYEAVCVPTFGCSVWKLLSARACFAWKLACAGNSLTYIAKVFKTKKNRKYEEIIQKICRSLFSIFKFLFILFWQISALCQSFPVQNIFCVRWLVVKGSCCNSFLCRKACWCKSLLCANPSCMSLSKNYFLYKDFCAKACYL